MTVPLTVVGIFYKVTIAGIAGLHPTGAINGLIGIGGVTARGDGVELTKRGGTIVIICKGLC